MNTTSSLSRRCECSALVLGGFAFLTAVVLAGDVQSKREKDPGGEGSAKRSAKEAVKMVEAIANRNKPPRIVERQRVWPSRLALFPKDYDWEEEGRVRKTLRKLYQDPSAEVWEALVQKANDRRYCVTFYSGNSGDAEIRSVGSICHRLAYGRLCDVFTKYLPSFPPHGCPLYLQEVGRDLPAWRKQRKDKSVRKK